MFTNRRRICYHRAIYIHMETINWSLRPHSESESAAMREDISFKVQRTRIVPLRWLANYVFEPLSMKFFNIGLRRHDQLEDMGAEERVFKNDRKLNICWRLYEILSEPYMRWGTMYQLDMTKLKEELENMDLSGDEWNDYDENGVPYWEKTGVVDPDYEQPWDFVDGDGDAFRIIRK